MSLLLAIESSSNVYRVVLGRDGEAIFDSAVNSCDPSLRTLGALLNAGSKLLAHTLTRFKGWRSMSGRDR